MTSSGRCIVKVLAAGAVVVLLGWQCGGGRGMSLDAAQASTFFIGRIRQTTCCSWPPHSALRVAQTPHPHQSLRRPGPPLKRTFKNVPRTPCRCGSTYIVTELGLEYFPRYLSQMECNQTRCSNGYRCQPHYYNVTVLRKEATDGRCSATFHRERRSVVVDCFCETV